MQIGLWSLLSGSAWAAGGATSPNGTTPVNTNMTAQSPFNDYTAAVVVQVLLVTVLVIALLGGAFLVINLGLLSKRSEDKIGGRDPSDVGVLKTGTWPQEPEERAVFPALESQHNDDVVAAHSPESARGKEELQRDGSIRREEEIQKLPPRSVA